MNKFIKYSIYLQSFIIIGLLCSCATFDHGWNYLIPPENSADVEFLLSEAQQIESSASTSEDVKKLIETYKKIEKADSNNYHSLWKIGNYNILLGAAYAKKKKEKKYYYKEAIKYCEKAMWTNQNFKSEIKSGTDICEASAKLTVNEVDAMGYWYTARFYFFKDCLTSMRRLFNIRIIIDNNKMIEQIDQLDSTWAGGGNYFSRAIYYIATPERFGGSKDLANSEFSTAIQIGPNFLVNRWGRAKYLYSLTGNQNGFISDLEWVIAQDPHDVGNPYPWNVYFQNDAKEMLSRVH